MQLWQDIRYSVRGLWNKPGFTIAAVTVLGLGIGANTAVFSLVNAFLLRPVQITRPQEMAGLFSRDVKHPDNYRAFSYPNYIDIRDNNPAFSSLAAHTMAMIGVKDGDQTRRMFAGVVSSNFFSTLGASMALGRTFTAEEEKPDANAAVTVLSYQLWRKLGQDPGILGRQIRVNGRMFSVIGVTPKGFTGTVSVVSCSLYVPLGAYQLVANDFDGQTKSLSLRDNNVLIVLGRLKPGITMPAAESQLAVVATRMAAADPINKDQTLIVRGLSRMSIATSPVDDGGALRIPATLLLSLSAIVLLIASLNLANMMLAKGASRRKEIAVRIAIGGARGRIVQQLVTEGFVLAILGGIAGIAIASWSTSLLVESLGSIAPIDLIYDPAPDWRVIAATLGFCLLATVVFGLFPAWKLSRPDVWFDLKEASGEDVAGGTRSLFSRRNLLVMGQLSLSLVMLTAAGLFVYSAQRAANIQPGFSLDRHIVAEIDPSLGGYDEARGRQLATAVQDRLRQIPGVESVGQAASIPFGMVSLGKSIKPSEGSAKDQPAVSGRFNIVNDTYFQALGVPVLRGRAFMPAELQPANTHLVAIVDQLAASKLWPNGDAIGRHVRLDEGGSGGSIGISVDGAVAKPQDLEIVGVVGNVQEGILGTSLQPHVYIPLGQQYQSDRHLHIRTAALTPDAENRLLDTIRREIRAVDERLPLLALKPMRGHLESGVDIWVVRTGSQILTIFGSVALFLAVVGLYAVNAYTVSLRTREIGIRMALGADPGQTLAMILRDGLRVIAVGIGAGIVLAIGAGQVLGGILYGVRGFEPAVLIGAPLALGLVALLACYLPARRASRVDPMVALRYE